MGTDLETTQTQSPAAQVRETVTSIKARVQMVQQLMKDLMKRDVHYGQIPGTPKPTLYKPGAEIIALAFQFAPRYTVEDLSAPDSVRYRTTCELYSRETGAFIGSGQGECSSDEEKYHWRKPVSSAEYKATPEDRRRVKFYKSGQGEQVRIEPADIANTVLKMSEKRAFIDAIRTASSCSDMFAQDLEDLPEEVRGQMEGQAERKPAKPKTLGAEGWRTLVAQAEGFGYPVESITAAAAGFGYEGPGEKMPREIAKELYRAMRDNPRTAEPEDDGEDPDDDPDGEPISDAEREILEMKQPWDDEDGTTVPESEPPAKSNGRNGRKSDNPRLAKLVLQTKELEALGVTEEQWRAYLDKEFGTPHRSKLSLEELSAAIEVMEDSLTKWREKKAAKAQAA